MAEAGLGVRFASREWIEAVVEQDERALAALYDATFTRVFGLVRRIVRNTTMATQACPRCGSPKLPHRVCGECGFYRGQ